MQMKEAVTFILAKPSEAQELSELRRQVWASTYRGIFPDDMIDNFDYTRHNQNDLFRIQSQQYLVYFIMKSTEKVGYMILKKGNPLRLQSLYLLKAYQGKGIGTVAVDMVRAYCREQGIAEFYLDCHPDNRNALAFYVKMGGVITSRDEGHENNEENGVTFEFSI